jgi:hypothetical protein
MGFSTRTQHMSNSFIYHIKCHSMILSTEYKMKQKQFLKIIFITQMHLNDKQYITCFIWGKMEKSWVFFVYDRT